MTYATMRSGLEMRWTAVPDAEGRPRMQAQWIDPAVPAAEMAPTRAAAQRPLTTAGVVHAA